ncbi:site-specific integrase [Pseudomonas guariconensis]|uniref:site-specific integrase n=1 Tax=Pseudomonas guariconensis TaxID=1288410 RepID=UPI0025A937AE|nr:site-specific integrase [Pseudomonas guariconensis]MDM9594992.1 site-specific integrase [Pseudomonas guariconensis]MDM9607821.1 site-specific integrase [Pseudomonas guariconensis]MDM9612778.1 site-specific integrase [Pseudomonas guariconensis]
MVNDFEGVLTFPMLEYGATETPWDLRPLLFRGGAAVRVNKVRQLIESNKLGSLLAERIELVTRLHENLADDLAGGGSRFSADNKVTVLRKFFAWVDAEEFPLSLDSAPDAFIRWSEHMVQCHRIRKEFSERTLYELTKLIATMLDKVLGSKASLSKRIRVRKPRGNGKVHTSHSAKQRLQETFEFGRFLAAICDALTWEVTTGPLPVKVMLSSGQMLELWSGLRNPEKYTAQRKMPQAQRKIDTTKGFNEAWINDRSLRTRTPLVNLRIESEMLMFIAQTGLNLKQAHTLRLDQYHYTSHLDGYQVRAYKERREGEVLFEIFSSYKKWFERYLIWRAQWFSVDDEALLFPLVRSGGRLVGTAPQFTNLTRICREVGVVLVRPLKLRGTRINWLLRQSQNPEQVAEIAQHAVGTLLRVYAEPHPQTAMLEITRFHQINDPSISSPAPGRCVSVAPEPLDTSLKNVPEPDCINAAGCLFCMHHRDIESADHVWSLASLRHLKSLELARYRPPAHYEQSISEHPTFQVVDRLTAKLRFFEQSSAIRKEWVVEATARIHEEDYHPAWYGFIRLAELQKESAV